MADWILQLVFGMALALTVCAVVFGIRNHLVFRLRQRVLDDYLRPATFDDLDRACAIYDSVSYDRMVMQFWRPLTVAEWWPEFEPEGQRGY